MNQRLKRWESPRKEGRNDKGKGGSARQRQKRKQLQMLRKKLNSQTKRDGDLHLFLLNDGDEMILQCCLSMITKRSHGSYRDYKRAL